MFRIGYFWNCILLTVIEPCHAASVAPNVSAMAAAARSVSYLTPSQAGTKWNCSQKKMKLNFYNIL